MMEIFECLLLFGFCLFLCRKYQLAAANGALWTVIFAVCLRWWISANLQFVYLFWFGLGFWVMAHDERDGWFDRRWIIAALLMVLSSPFSLSWTSRLLGMLWGLLGYLCMKKGWMGSADVCALLAAGFALGYERMMAAMVMACCFALAHALVLRQKQIPFLFDLVPALLMAAMRGVTMVEWLSSVWK